MCTSLPQHCTVSSIAVTTLCSFSLSQRCARFRCHNAVLVSAVTTLCSFSLSQRCVHRCLTAVGFLLCSYDYFCSKSSGRIQATATHKVSEFSLYFLSTFLACSEPLGSFLLVTSSIPVVQHRVCITHGHFGGNFSVL